MRLYFHPDCAAHEMGRSHPESPSRLRAVRDGVLAAAPAVEVHAPGVAPAEALARAHSVRYVEALFAAAPASGRVQLDPDTAMNPHSLGAARRAAGALLDATDAVLDGAAQRAFCCVRPPGHHAERERVMGFCFFNSVAVAALHALEVRGLTRVAILDFDVHHGNGTEQIFRDDPRVLVCSTYQHPFYPFTNTPSVPGKLINVPLAAGTGGAAFRTAVETAWLPQVRAFRPELLLISAGFDAHTDDPLAGLCLVDDDFAWLGDTLGALAADLCGERAVATLEGGYDLAALGRSAGAFARAFDGAGRAPA